MLYGAQVIILLVISSTAGLHRGMPMLHALRANNTSYLASHALDLEERVQAECRTCVPSHKVAPPPCEGWLAMTLVTDVGTAFSFQPPSHAGFVSELTAIILVGTQLRDGQSVISPVPCNIESK